MTALAYRPLQSELVAADRRTRRSFLASFTLHVVLLLLWITMRQFIPEPVALVEITWLDPEPVALAAPVHAPTPVVSEPAPEAPTAAREEVVVEKRFERTRREAPVAPAPQRPEATSDQLRASLDELRVAPPRADLSRLAAAGPVAATRPAILTAPQVTGMRESLVRGESATRPEPATLERRSATVAPRSASLASVDVPRPTSTTAPQKLDDSVARRSIEGAMLMGEVADRPLLEKTMPAYPDRARREAVEATVTLRFVVLADGRLTPNVRVERSSGHSDFDRNAIDALRTWRFAPLPAGKTGEQWGAITFEFRLRDR